MKVFIVFSVTIIGLALAGKGGKAAKNGEDDSCGIDAMTMGAMCVSGTAMGAKMETAFADCYNMPQEESRAGKKGKGKAAKGKAGKKGKGKSGKGKGGKGKTCPDFEDLLSKIDEESTDHQCFMDKMGWMDSDGNMLQDVHDADMASLNSALTAKIDEQSIADCASEKMEKMSKEGEQCASSYNEEQLNTLQAIGQAMAEGACSHKAFMTACGEYVKESFQTFLTTAKTEENGESNNGGKGGKSGKGGKGGKKGKGKKGK